MVLAITFTSAEALKCLNCVFQHKTALLAEEVSLITVQVEEYSAHTYKWSLWYAN